MSNLVTRCPHCETSFHVSEEQLSAARGAVRCGACLAVFDAMNCLVDDEQDQDQAYDDVEGIDDIDGLEPVDSDAERDVDADIDIEDELQARLLDGEPGSEDRHFEDDGEPVFLEDVPESFADEFEEGSVSSVEEVGGDATEVSVSDALEGVRLIHDEFDAATFEGEVNVDAVPDEVVLEYTPETNSHWLGWTLGCLAMVSIFVLQLAWFDRDVLAQDPGTREYLEKGCRALGCELPVYSDPDALHATHLVVRTHPKVSRALQVDALVRNDAPWKQYFPDLSLAFSDIHGHPVAARTFKPAEYLGGEMTGLKFIPAQTEVRISLEIVDPGPAATSYSLTVVK